MLARVAVELPSDFLGVLAEQDYVDVVLFLLLFWTVFIGVDVGVGVSVVFVCDVSVDSDCLLIPACIHIQGLQFLKLPFNFLNFLGIHFISFPMGLQIQELINIFHNQPKLIIL